ncbi:MAG: hypothetical protein LBC67_00625 [Spirochaetales bacterium]|jgi:uncharacterized membrane protein|nr:hypothetical protein [Spirochaetales bacterium]
MDNSLPEPQNNRPAIIRTVESHEVYSGPIPSPEDLQAFGRIDSSFPERIMKMTEANNNADVTTKNRFSLVNLIVPVIGQAASFVISCIGFGSAVFLAIRGVEGAAITAAIGGIAPIVIAALANFKKSNNNSR